QAALISSGSQKQHHVPSLAPMWRRSQATLQAALSAGTAWMSSSGVHSSLQDIWQILDMGSSPSILSPQKGAAVGKWPRELYVSCFQKVNYHIADLTVKGTNIEVQPKLIANKSSRTHPIKSKVSHQMQKIRNYNVKH
uniref:Uncharacterized protein n=1 Tax=Chelonoidis abingdonii TaxID=106734 RepID=A0A8C0H9K0_CHEAB